MEKTLKLTADQAIKMLGKNDQLDELIKANFTTAELSVKITDRIKTFQDALDYNGETLDQFNARTANDSPDEVGYKKLKVIVQALNEGVVMNYNDVNEYKYYPWFYAAGSGSGFSFGDYGYVYSGSIVGARLCFKSKELAIYAGKQFTAEYNEFINQ